MVMVRPFIDGGALIRSEASTAHQLRQLDGQSLAKIIAVEGENARVLYPADSENEVVAPLQPGVYPPIGGEVPVLVTRGRIVHVSPPADCPLEGSWAFGDASEKLLEATTSAYVDEQLAEAREEVEDIRDNLQNSLDSAQATANQAATDAADAKGKVQAAHDAAMNAVEQVQGAVDAAAEAAGIAAGKANVLIQDATPSEEYRKDTTLWIDTTGGANDPKRWDGTAWVSVGDGKIAQAAADAATAAKDAELAMTAANGKSKITYSAATPSKPNTGDRWYNSTTGLAQIWDGTAWVSTAPGDGFVPALDIGKATVGDMEVGRLKAQASTFASAVIEKLIADAAFLTNLYAKRIVIDGEDLAPGPGGYEAAYDLGAACSFGKSSSDPTGKYIRIDPAGGSVAARTAWGPMVPITGGVAVTVEAYATYESADPKSAWSTAIYWYKADGETPSSEERTLITTEAESAGQTGWSRGTATAPADAKWARVQFYSASGSGSGYRGFRSFSVRKQVGAVLIEDGAITTPKLNVTEEMSAAIGKFLKVTTDQLVAGSAKIAGELIAEELVGKIIRGGAFYWDTSTAKMSIEERHQVVGNPPMPRPGIFFDDENGNEMLSLDATQGRPGLYMESARSEIGQGTAFADGGLNMQGMTLLQGNQNVGGYLEISPRGSDYDPSKDAHAYVSPEEIRTSGKLCAQNQPVSTSAANCVWAVKPLGYFYIRSSLRRHKLNIREISDHVDPWAILNVPVVDWFDRTQTEERAEALEIEATNREAGTTLKTPFSTAPLRRIPGVVAEDVEAAGLGLFCEWDGSEVRGVQYERLPLLLIPIVKQLRNEIEELKKELSER